MLVAGYDHNTISSEVWRCYCHSIDPDLIPLHEGVLSTGILQPQIAQYGDSAGRLALHVVPDEMEGGVETILHNGVLTVTLEVVPAMVKGQIVRVAPYLTDARFCQKKKMRYLDLCDLHIIS